MLKNYTFFLFQRTKAVFKIVRSKCNHCFGISKKYNFFLIFKEMVNADETGREGTPTPTLHVGTIIGRDIIGTEMKLIF